MSDSAFFKVKSSKRSNPEARTTLDAIHSQKIQTMLDQKENLSSYKNDLADLKKRITETNSDIEIWRLEREAESLEKKIKSIDSDSDLMDYYLRTGDILYNYYDIQDQIQQGTNTYNITKAKPGSILAILEEVAQEERQQTKNAVVIPPAQKGLQRNQLLNDYLQLENPSMARNTIEEYDDPWFGLNFFVFCILTLAIVLYFTKEIRDEGFFVSPGTLDQLASTEGFDNTGALIQLESTEPFDNTGALTQLQSTRVVSKQEEDIDDEIYDNLTRQGIINMTESGYKGSDYASAGAMY
jgi:hypothetical protein